MPGFCVRLFLEELLRYDDLYCAVQYAEFERGCSEQFAVDLQQHVGRRGYRYAASLHMPDVPDLVYFAVEEFAQAEYYVPPVERAYERQVEQAVVGDGRGGAGSIPLPLYLQVPTAMLKSRSL